MTTAKAARPGQPAKYIPNCESLKGYLVQKVTRGSGKIIRYDVWTNGIDDAGEEPVYEKYSDFYKPYFNNDIVLKNWNKEKFQKEVSELDARQIIGTEYEKSLIKWGENEGGLLVEDTAEINKRKEAEAQHEIATAQAPVEFYSGIYGLRMKTRLPAELWAKIKMVATYHKGDEDDMEFLDDQGYYGIHPSDVKGYTYKEEAIDILIKAGLKVSYRNFKILSSADIEVIDTEMELENNKINTRVKEINIIYSAFQKRLYDMANSGEYVSSEEAASSLKKITLPGWEGANIYGGGKWLHIKDNDLYIVYNNGHDGDDWSRNNYGTGGAGATCYKAINSAGIVKEINDWIESLGKDVIYINS